MMTMNGNSVTPPVPYRRRKHKNLVNSLKESDTDNDSKFQHKERSALDSHKRKEFSTWEQKKKCSPLVQRMCERFESSDISKGKGSECTNEMKFDVKNLHHDEVDFKNDQHQKVKGHSGHHSKSKDCFYVIGEKSEATSATVGKLAKSSSLDIPLQNEKKEQQSNCVSSVCMEQVTINKINHAHKTNSIKQLGVGCKDSTNCDYSAQKLASYSSSEPKSEEATREKRQYSHKCGRNEDKIGITSQFISIFQKQNVNIPEENRGIQTAFKGVVKKQTIDSEEDSANSFLKGTQMALRKKKGFPPSKPPRTFAHDIYKESKIKSTAFVFENLEHDENTKRKGVSSTTKEKHKSTDDFAKRTHVKQVVKQKPVTPPKPPQFVYLEDKICLPTNVEVCCDSRAMIQSTVSPLKEEKQYQGRFLAEFSMFQDGIEPYAVSHHLPLKNRYISSRIDSDLHNQLYDNANQNDLKIFVDLTPTTVSPPKHYGTLKRHFSDEHIYAEPFGSCDHSQMKKTFVEDCTYSSPVDVVRKQNGLHYMCSPLPFCQNDNELRTSKGVKQAVLTASPRLKKMGVTHVKELINNSFGVIRRQFQGLASNEMVDGDDEDDSKGDSDNEVSDGDVQNRIIYVRSLKKQVSYAKGPESNSIFCSVILVAVRKDAQGQPQPYVALRYPKQENLVYDSNILSHLCFPDANSLKPTSVYKSESFFFMLFDEKDEKIHGYCCRLLGGPSQPSTSFVTFPAAVCIFSVSCLLPFYLKLLGELEKCFSHPELVWCNILTLLHKSKLPTPGEALSVSYQNIMEISVIRPLEDAKFRVSFEVCSLKYIRSLSASVK
ncbi:uncharacterized protein LOC143258700 isoform X1 [Tachypleus tridentatus]|uniref:uncharacterized protein LOC143258700 isoform X1 n=2 Tax=Tachypleus tridentatus TaxID=6853 RepID=UPI003FCF2E6F